MQMFYCVAICLLLSYVSCRHRKPDHVSSANSTDAAANSSTCQGDRPHMVETEGNALLDLGHFTVDMVKALASDGDSREVNLRDLTQLVTALAESSVLVDNPKDAAVHLDTKLAVKLNILEETVNEQLRNLSRENQQLKESLALLSQRAGVTAYLSTSTSTKDTPIKFNNIISIQGDYYDDSFGTFTCPVDGDYFVSSTLKRSSSNSNSWSLSIKQEGGRRLAYAAEGNSMYGGSLTTSVIVHCQALSKLWVEFGGSGPVVGDYNIPYSTFTVYLLKADG